MKNSKEIALRGRGGDAKGKVAFHSGETSPCVELFPCKWIFGFRAWESCGKNKGVDEQPQSFWEREPCLCLLEPIWSSVCLKEMPLGKRRPAYLCCVQECFDWPGTLTLLTQKLARVSAWKRRPNTTTQQSLKHLNIGTRAAAV